VDAPALPVRLGRGERVGGDGRGGVARVPVESTPGDRRRAVGDVQAAPQTVRTAAGLLCGDGAGVGDVSREADFMDRQGPAGADAAAFAGGEVDAGAGVGGVALDDAVRQGERAGVVDPAAVAVHVAEDLCGTRVGDVARDGAVEDGQGAGVVDAP